MSHQNLKSVFVRAYDRFRKGQWEHVCQHRRSLPGQQPLFV